MKSLILVLLISSTLFSNSIFTLDNVKNISIFFSNKSGFIDKEQKKSIKKYIQKELENAGFVFGKPDSNTMVIKIRAKELDDTYFISIQVGMAEEVITKRENNIETFAYTYLRSELIESEEPYEDTVDMIDFLLNQFILAHKDDNEE